MSDCSAARRRLCIVCLCALFGCIPGPHLPNPDVPHLELARAFYNFKITPAPEREKLFKSYNLDEKYELLIYGNQIMHPPDFGVVEWFAEEGLNVIPFLTEKLRETQKELTIRDIIHVFSYMALEKRYDFSKDQELLALLDQKAQGLGLWKDTVPGMISEVRTGELAP